MEEAHFELHASIEDRHWWFAGRRRVLRALVRECVPPGGGRTVVDVGCGTGANVAAFSDEYVAVGVDPSAQAVARARARFPDVRFLAGDARRVARRELAEAAAVLLTDVLEHVPEDGELLGGILEAMSAGSVLLVTVPAHPELWSQHDLSFGHLRRYTPERLSTLWQGRPAAVELLSYFNARLYPLARAVRAWARRTGFAPGPEGTDFVYPPRPANAALARIFAGETRRLVRLLRGDARPYATGLSLIALLRRTPV
ncbi:MAG: class I SAM-dependent methyltransferase [Gemmatimonadota bacterium]